MNKFHLLGAVCVLLLSFSANASMVTGGLVADSSDYSTLISAWDPGTDTVRAAAGNPAPGGATWSIMGADLADLGYDSHGVSLTTAMTLLPGLSGVTTSQIEYLIDYSLDLWASVSGFTNLGQVADGGVALGDTNANGGNLGDIRIGAIYIDGSSGPNELAHAFNPCNETLCGAGGSIGGDLHFDDSNTWYISDVDGNGTQLGTAGPNTYDLLTVLIHELGHSLGMGHSAVDGSVMEPVYAGIRTTLTADDIAGIQAIYGGATTPVPLPGALLLFLSGLSAFGLYGRKRSVA